MVSGVYWSVGSRSVNEDSLALESVRTDRGECTLMAVCDGIGSLDRGETVSGYVTECLVRWFYKSGIRMCDSSVKKIKRSLCKCLYDCHSELKVTADNAGLSWGTTCTCVFLYGRRFVYVHLGDSCCYHIFRSGRTAAHAGIRRTAAHAGLKRLTQAHVNPRGELNRCLGSMRYYAPDTGSGRLRKGSGLLVASDGFTGHLSERELADSLDLGDEVTNERIERRLAGIGAEIARRGGSDNRSAVCVLLK